MTQETKPPKPEEEISQPPLFDEVDAENQAPQNVVEDEHLSQVPSTQEEDADSHAPQNVDNQQEQESDKPAKSLLNGWRDLGLNGASSDTDAEADKPKPHELLQAGGRLVVRAVIQYAKDPYLFLNDGPDKANLLGTAKHAAKKLGKRVIEYLIPREEEEPLYKRIGSLSDVSDLDANASKQRKVESATPAAEVLDDNGALNDEEDNGASEEQASSGSEQQATNAVDEVVAEISDQNEVESATPAAEVLDTDDPLRDIAGQTQNYLKLQTSNDPSVRNVTYEQFMLNDDRRKVLDADPGLKAVVSGSLSEFYKHGRSQQITDTISDTLDYDNLSAKIEKAAQEHELPLMSRALGLKLYKGQVKEFLAELFSEAKKNAATDPASAELNELAEQLRLRFKLKDLIIDAITSAEYELKLVSEAEAKESGIAIATALRKFALTAQKRQRTLDHPEYKGYKLVP